jgi:hypothetical protein
MLNYLKKKWCHFLLGVSTNQDVHFEKKIFWLLNHDYNLTGAKKTKTTRIWPVPSWLHKF